MATTYAPHYRVTASGVMLDGTTPVEIFSYGFSLGVPGPATGQPVLPAIDDGVFGSIRVALSDFHANPSLAINQSCVLTLVKVASIKPDGTYGAPPTESDLLGVAGGANIPYSHPFQVALAVTMDGPPAVHRSHGRFYLPCVSQSVAPGGRISTANRDAVAGAASILFSTINAIVDNDTPVVIASQLGNGHNNLVAEVRCGRVMDTQRRRRNALVEDYASADVTPP